MRIFRSPTIGQNLCFTRRSAAVRCVTYQEKFVLLVIVRATALTPTKVEAKILSLRSSVRATLIDRRGQCSLQTTLNQARRQLRIGIACAGQGWITDELGYAIRACMRLVTLTATGYCIYASRQSAQRVAIHSVGFANQAISQVIGSENGNNGNHACDQ